MFGKCKVVKYIADTGIIYIDVGSRVNNSTPLHVSLLYDKGDVADILVVSGASVNCLTLDTRYSPMHYAILCNSVEYLEMLYESEGDLNIHHRAYNIEPLLVTAAKCNSYNVANFLLEHDVSVDTVADNGHTALHHAVRLRNRRLIRLFLNRGASVNIQGHDGQTVLHFLSEICIRDILQIFVGRSMTLIILDNGGMNPLHLAAQNGNYAFLQMFAQDVALWYTRTANENMDYPIHLAALGGYVNIVVLFLREMDADVQNALGRTVLFNAAVKGSENLVRLLLQRGASVNGSQQSRDGVTPLHAAISCKSNKVVKLLLEHHADMNVRAFPEQYTPLHWAISTNDEESVKRLLRWRADREIRTSNGYNAVDLARALGRWNMVEYIYHGDRL
jgi:ankyrin repeat protein